MKLFQWFYLNCYICFNTSYANSVHVHTNPPINVRTRAHNIHAKKELMEVFDWMLPPVSTLNVNSAYGWVHQLKMLLLSAQFVFLT